MKPLIERIATDTKGPTVAIFGGVHGNEKVGVRALQWIKENIAVNSGTLYLVQANPQAMERNVRFTEKNLNRCFILGNTCDTYEDSLARDLMELLDQCDALLDLHSYSNPMGKPFAICEESSFHVAKHIDVRVISSGWTIVEPVGTDGYMASQNKVGICVECGQHDDPACDIVAQQSIMTFLVFLGMVNEPAKDKLTVYEHDFFEVQEAVLHNGIEIAFTKEYDDFEMIPRGEIFAHRGEEVFRAQKDCCIVFPNSKECTEGEAFILGTKKSICTKI